MEDNNEQERRSESPEVSYITLERLSALLAASAESRSNGGLGSRNVAATALAQLLLGNSRDNGLGYRTIDDDEDNEDDGDWVDEDDAMEEDDWSSTRTARTWIPPHSQPQQAGIDLLNSGEFGRVDPKVKARRNPRNVNIAKVISSRLSKPHPALYQEDLMTNLVPNTNGTIVAKFGANIYTAQYSNDASFFYTCAQDFRLHLFDTTAPPENIQPNRRRHYYDDPSLHTTMKVSRRIQGQHGRWTITDANLSPDNQRIVYSSITSTAYMCSTTEDNPAQIPIPFADRPRRNLGDWEGGIALFSCRFSADGNEIIAGGRGQLFVYDLLANRRSVGIEAHDSDINSCCWADTASGNVLVSASDDSYLKVWDRRSLGASGKPSGVLVGHTEGITYVSAKGDGRYVLSNGKDQAMRLWDLRKMRGSGEYTERHYGIDGFDYRYPSYPKPRCKAHPQDCSVMTYRGHCVLMTLIRCHFSPAETTGGQYLYSGSADGKIHIWSLDGTIVQVLDRKKTLPMAVDYTGPEYGYTSLERGACVRDVSWHSQQPVLMSAAWEGSRSGSTLARHDWKGLSKMAGSLEDWNEKRKQEQAEISHSSRTRSGRRMPGSYALHDESNDDEDDEDYVP
ncbi:WD40 repeat-like protein [Marasmius fiardii PR-910]|nr:WD40 repeat-like protein [Marasmius fiardii PR-910]